APRTSLRRRLPGRLEAQRRRVDAVAQAGGRRPVLEDVAEMRIAGRAQHLDAAHAMARVHAPRDPALVDRRPPAGPAAARLVLALGCEQRRAAAHAEIASGLVVV